MKIYHYTNLESLAMILKNKNTIIVFIALFILSISLLSGIV